MWIAVLLCIVPQTEAVTEQIPTVELNHYYDFNASHVFTQNIYRDKDGAILAWHLTKDSSHKPIARRLTFYDGNTLRDIRCNRVYETWSQTDHELDERNERPTDQRRGLSKPITRRTAQELLGD